MMGKGSGKSMVMLGSAWPLRGGLANFNERLVREFMADGYTASIYTFSLQYPGIFFPGKSQYSDEPAPENLDIRVKVNSVNPFNWVRIGRELKKLKPDILVIKFWIPFMAPCFGTIARIVRKNRHTKVIGIIDNIIPHEKRPGDKMLAKYWTGSIDGFICMSQNVMDDLALFNRDKSRQLCPHPLYDNFGPGLPKEDACRYLGLDPSFSYILFFGFIRDYKGLDLLLKAFPGVLKENSQIKLIVAGEFYTDPKPYQDLIDALDLSKSLVLKTDFIPDSEVRYYFSACDLVVQPYKHATQSGVTQIAYHFEKPIVTTNVGGLADMVPDGKAGYVVKPVEDEISSAVLDFFSSGKADFFRQNLLTEKEKYSWKRMLKTIENLAYQ